jgi:stringent starvation protein B
MTEPTGMSPSKPYLLRAIYEWIVDNGMTPHLLVNTEDARVRVPTQFVKDNSIVLNISPGAVRDLLMRNDFISFSARFGGKPHEVLVPISAARMIYARENGQGMTLPDDAPAGPEEDASPPPASPPSGGGAPPKGAHLRRVK